MPGPGNGLPDSADEMPGWSELRRPHHHPGHPHRMSADINPMPGGHHPVPVDCGRHLWPDPDSGHDHGVPDDNPANAMPGPANILPAERDPDDLPCYRSDRLPDQFHPLPCHGDRMQSGDDPVPAHGDRMRAANNRLPAEDYPMPDPADPVSAKWHRLRSNPDPGHNHRLPDHGATNAMPDPADALPA